MHDLPGRGSAGIHGYPRTDGRKGIRNVVAVVYTVECAHVVADAIAAPFLDDAHVIGFGGCYPSAYAHHMLERLCTHPNVGAAVLVSLGCEGLDRERLAATVAASGRPVTTLVIQREGGTRATVEAGRAWIEAPSPLSRTTRACSWTRPSWSWGRSAAARTAPAGSPPTRSSAGSSTGTSPRAARPSSRRPAS